MQNRNQTACRLDQTGSGGDGVLLTQGNKPMAKIVSASENGIPFGTALNIRSIKGHRILTPVISQGELAAEMFGRE
jgi:hypothetical protein